MRVKRLAFQADPPPPELPIVRCHESLTNRIMTAHTVHELHAVAARATAAPIEVLTLRLGAEEYGIDILRVQEIRSYEQPTRIAVAPPHVLGVTNLRGVIVPIIDLRCRFGLEAAYGSDTVNVEEPPSQTQRGLA